MPTLRYVLMVWLIIMTAGCETRLGEEERPVSNIRIGWAKDRMILSEKDDRARVLGYLTFTPHYVSGHFLNVHNLESASVHCSIIRVTHTGNPELLRYLTHDGIFVVRLENDSITSVAISGNRSFEQMMEQDNTPN